MKTPTQLHNITKQAMDAYNKGDKATAVRLVNNLTTSEMAVVMKALASHLKSKGVPLPDSYLKLGI